VDTVLLQDLAVQSAEALRRSAEKRVRDLQSLGQPSKLQSQGEALRRFLADTRADLVNLRLLRRTADELLRERCCASARWLWKSPS
jgi:hypothetical protein